MSQLFAELLLQAVPIRPVGPVMTIFIRYSTAFPGGRSDECGEQMDLAIES